MSVNTADGATHDVIIIGSGLTGSALGAILARAGCRVLLLDRAPHPRFTLGEAATPRLAAALRALAERYHVPELKTPAAFDACTRVIGPSSGIKRHFGFLLHHAGRRQDPAEVTMSTNGPLSAECHLFRQDVDAYLYHTAVRYGCTARFGVTVSGVEVDDGGVTVHGADGREYRARYVVDASDRDAPLAEVFGLREEPTRLRHRSRSLWTHAVGVVPADEVFGGPGRPRPPAPWHQGTVHHIFDGGWFAVIPFGNDRRTHNPLCSVGLSLDSERHPGGDTPPGEEFAHHVARFPDVERQLGRLRAVREWVRTERQQYSSTRVVGDRWCVIGEAAGFVDHLFSRSLSNAVETVDALAWRLIAAVKDGDFSAERFRYVETLVQNQLDADDDLVRCAYTSFADYRLWSAVFRIWAWGSGAGSFRLQRAAAAFRKDGRDEHFRALEDAPHVGFYWPDNDGYRKLFDEMVARCEAFGQGHIGGAEAADELYAMLRDSAFVPRHVGFAEFERFIAPTPPKIARMAGWAVTKAEPEVRRLLMANLREAVAAAGRGRKVF